MVSGWSGDEGWGVIASDDTPGGCWAHYSSLEIPGFRSLDVGERVDFQWEEADQDGFGYRAVRVCPQRARSGADETHAGLGTRAYRSRLSITPDEAD